VIPLRHIIPPGGLFFNSSITTSYVLPIYLHRLKWVTSPAAVEINPRGKEVSYWFVQTLHLHPSIGQMRGVRIETDQPYFPVVKTSLCCIGFWGLLQSHHVGGGSLLHYTQPGHQGTDTATIHLRHHIHPLHGWNLSTWSSLDRLMFYASCINGNIPLILHEIIKGSSSLMKMIELNIEFIRLKYGCDTDREQFH